MYNPLYISILVFFVTNLGIPQSSNNTLNSFVIDPFLKVNENSLISSLLSENATELEFTDSFTFFTDNKKLDHSKYLNFYLNNNYIKTKTLFSVKAGYSQLIDSNLTKHHLPQEYSLIPMLLSSYNCLYVNKYGGSGIWGLNYVFAAKHNLTMNTFIDERKNDTLATEAVLIQLKHLHNKYNDLSLTFLAYVSSPTLVNKIIKRSESNDLNEIIPLFEDDFQELVLAFNALIHINKNKDLYGFSNKAIRINENNTASTLILHKKLFFDAVADCIEFNFRAFKKLNPEIRKDIFPTNYPMKFDSQSLNILYTNLDSIYYYQDSILFNLKANEDKIINGQEMITYTVRSGDYLGKIAELNHVKVSDIQKWNDLNGTRINVGQKLIVYQPKPPLDRNEYVIYKVEQGDSLWKIAEKYSGISVKNIMDLNHINNKLKPGQLLKIKKK